MVSKMVMGFGDQVESYMKQYRGKFDETYQITAMLMFEEAQTPVARGGHMPVDTAFLRNTFTIRATNGAVAVGPDAHLSIMPTLKMGDSVEATWPAVYAEYQHSGYTMPNGEWFEGHWWAARAAANYRKHSATAVSITSKKRASSGR